MTTVTVVAMLVAIAALAFAFSGLRASCGRIGLVRHRRADMHAAIRGVAFGTALVAAPVAIVVVDAALRQHRESAYRVAGEAMRWVYVPYGLVVLASLAAYGTLAWRVRFLAGAILLGPLTLVRPLLAVGGVCAAFVAQPDILVGALAVGAVSAVLGVEPVAGRIWYSAAPLRDDRAVPAQPA